MEHPVESLYYVTLVVTLNFIFWILHLIREDSKHWFYGSLIFPPFAILYIYSHKERMGYTAAMFAIFLFLTAIVSQMVGYPFFTKLMAFLQVFAFWPYHLVLYLMRTL